MGKRSGRDFVCFQMIKVGNGVEMGSGVRSEMAVSSVLDDW